jgi:hypothetical protein
MTEDGGYVIPIPFDKRSQGVSTLIATRLAIQELVKDHNTLELIENDVFSLKSLAGMPKYDQPQVMVEVKDDLKHFTVTYEFHASDTDEARKFREEAKNYSAKIQARFENWKATRSTIGNMIKEIPEK